MWSIIFTASRKALCFTYHWHEMILSKHTSADCHFMPVVLGVTWQNFDLILTRVLVVLLEYFTNCGYFVKYIKMWPKIWFVCWKQNIKSDDKIDFLWNFPSNFAELFLRLLFVRQILSEYYTSYSSKAKYTVVNLFRTF